MKKNNQNQSANKQGASAQVTNYFANVQTLADAKKLWKKLSLELHPDKNGGNDAAFKEMERQYDNVCRKMEHAARMEELKKTAYILSENDLAAVSTAKKKINEENKVFRRELATNLLILERQYKEMEETQKAFNYLARVTSTPVEKFFDVDFVRALYKPYTFTRKDGGVHTCFAEKRKKSEKTDFAKLEERIYNNIGEELKLSDTLNTKTGEYYIPVYNFSASNILKYLQSIDTYVFSLNQYKEKKREEARKAKKQAKKQREAQAAAAYEQATAQAEQGEASNAAA